MKTEDRPILSAAQYSPWL